MVLFFKSITKKKDKHAHKKRLFLRIFVTTKKRCQLDFSMSAYPKMSNHKKYVPFFFFLITLTFYKPQACHSTFFKVIIQKHGYKRCVKKAMT